MTDETKLPRTITRPVDRDFDLVREMTGLPESAKIGGKKGYQLPDKEEDDLVEEVKVGYLRVLDAGNPNPEIKHVVGASRKRELQAALLKATTKGNAYDKLLIPIFDPDNSPYREMVKGLLLDPSIVDKSIPALRPDVDLKFTGRKAPELPAV